MATVKSARPKSTGIGNSPEAITADEYKFILGLIAESNFPGKEVLVVADIVNKIKSHVESIERRAVHSSSSFGQHNHQG